MKKQLTILLVCLIPVFVIGQDKKGFEVKPYGFLKGDMVITNGGVYSWGGSGNCYLSAPQFASGLDTNAIGFTGQHSRFGLKIKGGGEDIKVGGVLELDFYYGGFDANARPRIRQAWASMAKGDFEVRFGQQWDIFSPVNASTNNTNGNMWYSGNRGFRRGMIQFRYKLPAAILVQLAVGEGTKEASGLGMDNLSGSPMIQGRISKKFMEKYTIGFSFANASFSPYTHKDSSDYDFSAFGICFDFSLPIHKYFALKGEFNTGTNLNNANLFSIAGNNPITVYDSVSGMDVLAEVDIKSMGMWFNATSKISEHFTVVIGYGMDKNNTDDLAAGKIEQNNTLYGDLIYNIGYGCSVALEYQSITTKIKDGKEHSARIINVSGKIVF